jgi:sugar phosphate isomerase/epimerase
MSLKPTAPNPLSRRAFLAIGAAAGSVAFAGGPFGGDSVFASPFSDSSQGGAARKSGKVPVGIELYTVRDALKADLMGTVRGVAKMGYEVVEFYSPYYDWTPQQASDVKKLLDDLGVKALSTHNSASVFTPEGIQKAIDLNQAIGSKCIVMASAGGKVADAAGWKAVADKLNFGAEKLAPLGMTVGFHNHAAEWRPVEGQRPMDILAKNTKKEVTLQLDLGTCVEAGADPVAWINANPGRIRSLHCKEWSKEKGYAVLFGEGQVPWADVFKAAESVGGVEFYLVEQEEGPSDQQMARAEQCLANWKKMRG